MTEQDLIELARAGDAEAFADLVTPHLPAAYRTAVLITSAYDSAQDAVQEGLIEVHRSLSRFRSGAAFRPWFLKLVVHRALNQRRRSRSLLTLEPAPEVGTWEGSPERCLLSSERRAVIWQSIQELDPEHRAVVVLHYYQDLSIAETADILNIPQGTVKSRLHTARARIEKRLAAALGQGDTLRFKVR